MGRERKKKVGRETGDGGVKTKPENPLPKIELGVVCAQMVRCGKPNCKCSRGELHGPYFYHFARVNGVLIKRYIKAKDVLRVRAACAARREQERLYREAHRINTRQLMKAIEQLREGEKLLLQFLETHDG